MGGGGPSSAQSSSTFSAPGWATGDLKKYIESMASQVFGPGGPGGGTNAMPAGLNQQVAPFTPDQQSALSGISGLTGVAENLTGLGASDIAQFASGANAGPNNPYLAAYYGAAAQPTVTNYQNAVQPGLQAQAEQTGSFGGTGMMAQQGVNQQNLGNTLANLGASIYEPAYQQGQQLQFQAGQALPGAAAAMYQPYQAQYGAGAAQQAQTQAGLNTGYQNALTQIQWPFALLSEYGQALGMGLGSGGTTIGTQPIVGGSGTKL
jgi:hypothetical protein